MFESPDQNEEVKKQWLVKMTKIEIMI